MTDLRQAAQQALEALENTSPLGFNMESDKKFFAAITALRTALEQQQVTTQAQAATNRVIECAVRLVQYSDFQLGGILSADSKAKDIPSNAVSSVKARHLAALRDAIAGTPPQQQDETVVWPMEEQPDGAVIPVDPADMAPTQQQAEPVREMLFALQDRIDALEAQRKPLTAEWIDALANNNRTVDLVTWWRQLARAIEAAHNIKE